MKFRLGQSESVRGTVIGLARSALMALVVIGVACTDSTGPIRPIQILPATSTVTLQATPQGQTLSTSVTLTNTSPFPVSYSYCGVSLEKAPMPVLPPGHTDWTPVWTQICYALDDVATQSGDAMVPYIYHGPVVQPGEAATIPISAVVGQQPFPNFTGEPGEYRFRIPLSIGILGDYLVAPREQSVSEPFTLLPSN